MAALFGRENDDDRVVFRSLQALGVKAEEADVMEEEEEAPKGPLEPEADDEAQNRGF